MSGGKISEEREYPVPAAEAWKLFGSLQVPKIVKEALPTVIDKIVPHGDGSPGTVLHVFYVPGAVPGLTSFKEKFTVVDNEKRVKEVEVFEGGYLDLGFTLYRTIFEVFEKSPSSSLVRISIEYELKGDLSDEEAEAAKKRVSLRAFVVVMQYAADNYLK